MAIGAFPADFCIRYHGQTYRPVATRDYINRQNKRVTLVDWQSTCPTCGNTFILTTGPCWDTPNRRRCPNCRAPGKHVRREMAATDQAET